MSDDRVRSELRDHEKALESLAGALKGPLTADRLKTWAASTGRIGERFLRDRIFGKIRWPKSVGRCLGPTLSGGFRGEIWFHYLNWEVGPDGVPIDISKWVRVPDPFFWDLPDDGDLYQVGYGGYGVRPWMNAVIVDFAKDQPWDTPFQVRVKRSYRVVVPGEQDFAFLEADFAVLEDRTIEEVPIRYF